MTSFSNDEESIEQRTEKYYKDDDEENNSTEDGDEADDHDDDEEEGDGEEETDNGETGSDTEHDEVDPWDKLREEAINDLNSAWEEEVVKMYARVCKRMMLRSKLLTVCFLFTAKSYDTYIYNM